MLPLNTKTVGKVAVVGPNAAGTALLLGNYAATPTLGVVSVLDGITGAMLNSESPVPPYNWCAVVLTGGRGFTAHHPLRMGVRHAPVS